MRQLLLTATFLASAFVGALPAHGGRVADLPQLERLRTTPLTGKIALAMRRAPAPRGTLSNAPSRLSD